MTLVTFALPDESRDFLVRLGPIATGAPHGKSAVCSGRIGGESVAVFHTGVGDSPAQRARLEQLLAAQDPPATRVIIAGFAGALRPGVPVGDLVLGENHGDPGGLEAVRAALTGAYPCHVGLIRTVAAAVETAAAKASLHVASGGALAVDMETAWIADVAARAGVATLSLRVISDSAEQDFPVPGGVMFDPVRQRPRYVALPAYLLTHPARIGPFIRFVRGLGPARARLAGALEVAIRALSGPENHLAAGRPVP